MILISLMYRLSYYYKRFTCCMKKYTALLIFFLCASACIILVHQFRFPDTTDGRKKMIFLTTMGKISDKQAGLAAHELEAFYEIEVVLVGKSKLPDDAYCATRKRYVAVKILSYLRSKNIADCTEYNYKILALTDKDIETEQGRHWGVMGLAILGGDECVVSTFRLKGSEDRLKKVTLHETGHMLGINHCSSGTASCFMNDAKGKGATVDRARILLCGKCRSKMKF